MPAGNMLFYNFFVFGVLTLLFVFRKESNGADPKVKIMTPSAQLFVVGISTAYHTEQGPHHPRSKRRSLARNPNRELRTFLDEAGHTRSKALETKTREARMRNGQQRTYKRQQQPRRRTLITTLRTQFQHPETAKRISQTPSSPIQQDRWEEWEAGKEAMKSL